MSTNPITFRETRPDELTDAVMFAMAGGVALDPDSARHELCHVAKHGNEVVGAVVLARGGDAQETVTVHVDGAADDTSREEPPEDAAPTDAADASENVAANDGRAPVPDAGTLARHLLDLTLMKMAQADVRTTRLQAEPTLAERLWAEAGWLDRLPAFAPDAVTHGWLDGLRSRRPAMADAVQRAFDRAQRALDHLAKEAEPDPAESNETAPDDSERADDPHDRGVDATAG